MAWPGSGCGREQRGTGQLSCIGCAKNQVSVARQDTNVVGVFMERMLPPALANDAEQDLLAGMKVRVAVIGLVRVLRRIVGIHVIGHGAAVDHEVRRVVGLGGNLETASSRSRHAAGFSRDLGESLAVNAGVHLGELEEVLPVVAGLVIVVSR